MRGRALVVAVVAGALGAARSLMRRRADEDDLARTHVYIGARAASDVPLSEEVHGWCTAGADVVLCLSRQELEHDRSKLPRARREAGYVQDVIVRDTEAARLSPAVVFAAGPTAMLRAMHGLPGSVLEVVTNY